jgi:hypothetical protein
MAARQMERRHHDALRSVRSRRRLSGRATCRSRFGRLSALAAARKRKPPVAATAFAAGACVARHERVKHPLRRLRRLPRLGAAPLQLLVLLRELVHDLSPQLLRVRRARELLAQPPRRRGELSFQLSGAFRELSLRSGLCRLGGETGGALRCELQLKAGALLSDGSQMRLLVLLLRVSAGQSIAQLGALTGRAGHLMLGRS